MNLPDFNQYKPLTDLLEEMGAELFSRSNIGWSALSEEELDKELKTNGLIVNFDDIVFNEEGISTYRDRIVLFYMQTQQAYYGSGYKFHFTRCQTISQAINENRHKKYVITTRTDGFFDVFINYESYSEEKQIRLEPCKNCLKKANYKGYKYVDYAQKRKIYNDFQLGELLNTKISVIDNLTTNLFRDSKMVGINDYPPDFLTEIRPRIIKRDNYSCCKCGANLYSYRKYLHVHHIDSDKANNNDSNLESLCIKCHSEMPRHGFIKNRQEYKDYIHLIK